MLAVRSRLARTVLSSRSIATRGIATSGLKERLIEIMPEKQAEVKALKKEHG